MQNAQLLWAAGSMFGLWGSCYPFTDTSDSEVGCMYHLPATLTANLYILGYLCTVFYDANEQTDALKGNKLQNNNVSRDRTVCSSVFFK